MEILVQFRMSLRDVFISDVWFDRSISVVTKQSRVMRVESTFFFSVRNGLVYDVSPLRANCAILRVHSLLYHQFYHFHFFV